MSSRTDLYDDVVDVTSLSALDVVESALSSSCYLNRRYRTCARQWLRASLFFVTLFRIHTIKTKNNGGLGMDGSSHSSCVYLAEGKEKEGMIKVAVNMAVNKLRVGCEHGCEQERGMYSSHSSWL